eukprot:14215518-Alexandrium_andersonii.AAC.1
MSASLVGSEMCIRDSHLVAPGVGRDKWRKALPSPPATRAGAWTGTRMAVSYTHLTLPTICSV